MSLHSPEQAQKAVLPLCMAYTTTFNDTDEVSRLSHQQNGPFTDVRAISGPIRSTAIHFDTAVLTWMPRAREIANKYRMWPRGRVVWTETMQKFPSLKEAVKYFGFLSKAWQVYIKQHSDTKSFRDA